MNANLTTRTVPISKLLPLPGNPRRPLTPDDPGWRRLTKSLDEHGYVDPIICNERTGHVLSGNQRLAVLLARGVQEVDVVVVDIPPEREMAIALTMNNHAGAWDHDLLVGALDELTQLPDFDIEVAGFDVAEVADLLAGPHVEEADADDFDVEAELARAAEPITKAGELIKLGPHRVYCGDATKIGDVEQLFGDLLACDAVICDPPYGIDYVGKTRDALTIANDGAAGLLALLSAALGLAFDRCRPGAVWYITAPAGPLFNDFGTVLRRLGVWRQTLIWVKDTMVMGRSDYHYRHEPILYGWKPGAAHREPPDRKQTTLWEVDRPKQSRQHPTMKPVALFGRAISNSTAPGELVYDPCLGSGTTLVAAHLLGRRCFGMELDPKYVDVIVRRFLSVAGESAVDADVAERYRLEVPA